MPLNSLSLKRNIWIAVSLVTVIPVIVLFYYFSGYAITGAAVVILGFVVFLGWWVIFTVFTAIINLYSSGKRALRVIGEKEPPLTNEVKSLESIMNVLSSKVKTNLEELKNFSRKTDELNKEISQKVFVLSTILQANELYSKDAPAEEIIQLLMQHLKESINMDVCFSVFKGEDSDDFRIIACLGRDFSVLESLIKKETKSLQEVKKIILLDKDNKSPVYTAWCKPLDVKHAGFVPVVSRGRVIGVIGVGSRTPEFSFSKDCLEVLKLFAQNSSLVWEHKKLSARIKELEIFDYLTGLYNRKFILKRLNEEICRSVVYQRPCGFLLMEILNYDDYQREAGIIEAEKLIRKVADIFKETLRPIDFIGRTDPHKLAVILIEKNRRQSHQVANNLKEQLEGVFKDKVRLAFAVAENPLDGTTAEELLAFAQKHIDRLSHGG